MKRNLVVTSHVTVHNVQGVDDDAAVELAVAAEKRRVSAYLYSHSSLVAFVSEAEPAGVTSRRIVCRALVTVEGNEPTVVRRLADYQSGRLQSGSFGVEDYVEDEQAARRAVGVSEEVEEEITLAQALNEAADDLEREEVQYALGLDSDHVGPYTTVTVDGVERPYTDDDLAADLKRHDRIVQLLREAAIILADPR